MTSIVLHVVNRNSPLPKRRTFNAEAIGSWSPYTSVNNSSEQYPGAVSYIYTEGRIAHVKETETQISVLHNLARQGPMMCALEWSASGYISCWKKSSAKFLPHSLKCAIE